MSQLPTDWLKKIFDLMSEFYEDRWLNQLKDKQIYSFYETIWYNSLRNLTYEQIKKGLKKAKYLSKVRISKPPNNIEFYHLCVDIIYNKPTKKYYYVPRRT